MAGKSHEEEMSKLRDLITGHEWTVVLKQLSILPTSILNARYRNYTPLELAIRNHAPLDIVSALMTKDNINPKDKEHYCGALQLSVLKGHWKAVGCLLDNGADPNVSDHRGNTALHSACKGNLRQTPLDILQRLVTDKNINMQQADGNTPLLFVLKTMHDDPDMLKALVPMLISPESLATPGRYNNALHWLVRQPCFESIAMELLPRVLAYRETAKVDVLNAICNNVTALHLAIQRDWKDEQALTDVLKMLITKANINIPGSHPNLPHSPLGMIWSSESELDPRLHHLAVKVLLEHGADCNSTLPLLDYMGWVLSNKHHVPNTYDPTLFRVLANKTKNNNILHCLMQYIHIGRYPLKMNDNLLTLLQALLMQLKPKAIHTIHFDVVSRSLPDLQISTTLNSGKKYVSFPVVGDDCVIFPILITVRLLLATCQFNHNCLKYTILIKNTNDQKKMETHAKISAFFKRILSDCEESELLPLSLMNLCLLCVRQNMKSQMAMEYECLPLPPALIAKIIWKPLTEEIHGCMLDMYQKAKEKPNTTEFIDRPYRPPPAFDYSL